MTIQQAALEALADEYAHCAAKAHVEDLYGTSKGYTAECRRHESEARANLMAAIQQHQALMLNGMTEEETSATATVAGLQPHAVPFPPEAFPAPIPVTDSDEVLRLREHNQYLKTLVTNQAIRLRQLEAFANEALATAAQQPQAVPAQSPAEGGGDLLTCEIEPRPLSYSLRDYHRADLNGPLHLTWTDKPHRLLYDLIAAVRYYATAKHQPKGTTLTDEQADAIADAHRWDTREGRRAMLRAVQAPAPAPEVPAGMVELATKIIANHFTDEPEKESIVEEAWRVLRCDSAKVTTRADYLSENTGMPFEQALELAISEFSSVAPHQAQPAQAPAVGDGPAVPDGYALVKVRDDAHRQRLIAEAAGLTRAPKPVGYVAPHDLELLAQGYPQLIHMVKGAKHRVALYTAPRTLSTEEIKRVVTNEIGFDFEFGETQEVNGADLLNVVRAALAFNVPVQGSQP